MASGGYPESYKSGFEIKMDSAVSDSVYVAGAKLEVDRLLTAGGRVLGVVAVENTLTEAIDAAYEKVRKVSFEGAFYRSDIGKRALCAIGGER